MIRVALLAAALLVALPTGANAQAAPAPRADFTASIALHVSAALAGVVGTGVVLPGTYMMISGCGVGSNPDCEPGQALFGTGLALMGVSLILGITATVVHANTRASVPALSFVLPWWSPETGSGGATLGVSF